MKKLNYFLPIILPLFLTCGLFPFGPSGDLAPTIFFVAAEIGYGVGEIYSIRVNGSEFTQLTERDNYSKRDISLSPDGKMILYEKRGGDIVTMNIDGSNNQLLTFENYNGSLSSVRSESPSWSPDGSKIVFLKSTGSEQPNVFIMNADGSNHNQLTNTPEYKDLPRWMPDDTKIYYKSRDGLFIMDEDGSNHTQLTDFDLHDESVLYSAEDLSFYFLNRANDQFHLYKIGITGTGLTLVRSYPVEKMGLSLSPDLQKIAYRKGDDPENGVYIMNIDGSGEKLLKRADFRPGSILWSPDNQFILYEERVFYNTPVFIFDEVEILNIIRPDGTDHAVITDQIHRFFTNNNGISWLF